MGNPAKLFNTHLYIKKLQESGVSEAQAEVHAETLTALFEDRLATKDDLKKLSQQIQQQIDGLESRMQKQIDELQRQINGLQHQIEALDAKMQHQIESLEARMDIKLSALKNDMIKWFVGGLLTQTALVISLFKLFH